MSIPKHTEVVIVGAGPTGLTTALLLSRLGIPHLLVEQRRSPAEHPQAHFISTRSMEIFRALGGLDARIRAQASPLDEWRNYVYCTDLYHLPDTLEPGQAPSGSLLGVRDHFPSGPDHDLSPTWECHLPQHHLVRLLRDAVLEQEACTLVEGYRAEIHDSPETVRVSLSSDDGKAHETVDCQYIVCADGAHSACRDQLGLGRNRKTPPLQHLINVHFFSPQLSELLRGRLMGMLYFVHSPEGIGIFVNHSLAAGEFVLQLPFFPPHQSAEAFTRPVCAATIDALAGAPMAADIRSIRPWRLWSWVAERFHAPSRRCFLVGDAAHQFLPAGGFGMNCAIADAHNLAWKLAQALDRREAGPAPQALLDTYDAERRPLAAYLADLSLSNFTKSLAVASAIGLDWRMARWFDRMVRMAPVPGFLQRPVFRLGMRLGLSQVTLLQGSNPVSRSRRRQLETLFADPDANLRMRYPRQDLGAVYERGWLEGAVETDFYQTEAVDFTPAVATGTRLPHFWLQPTAADDAADPISSLDLPGLYATRRRRPVHLLLLVDVSMALGRRLADLRNPRFGPLEVVRIGMDPGADPTAAYHLSEASAGYRPPRGAVLVRPDGIVAWTW